MVIHIETSRTDWRNAVIPPPSMAFRKNDLKKKKKTFLQKKKKKSKYFGQHICFPRYKGSRSIQGYPFPLLQGLDKAPFPM